MHQEKTNAWGENGEEWAANHSPEIYHFAPTSYTRIKIQASFRPLSFFLFVSSFLYILIYGFPQLPLTFSLLYYIHETRNGHFAFFYIPFLIFFSSNNSHTIIYIQYQFLFSLNKTHNLCT